jgi:hypothetical protein
VYGFVADHSFRLIWGSKRKTPRPLIYLTIFKARFEFLEAYL